MITFTFTANKLIALEHEKHLSQIMTLTIDSASYPINLPN